MLAYNAQAAVDSQAPEIVAQGVSNCAIDAAQLEPMAKQIKTNTGRQTDECSPSGIQRHFTNPRRLYRDPIAREPAQALADRSGGPQLNDSPERLSDAPRLAWSTT